MDKTRRIVSLALEGRAASGIKVRQPLGLLKIKEKLPEEFFELIKGEVNVKKIKTDKKIKNTGRKNDDYKAHFFCL